MRLVDLAAALPGVEIDPAARDVEISRVEVDSRRVVPGDLFVAIRGAKSDGLQHAADAVARGAVAVVADRAPVVETPRGVPWIRLAAPRQALGRLAARIHGNPAERLVLAGVTGTNGKTSTATLLAAILEARWGASGFIGTTGYRTGRRTIEADRTTPEATVIQEILAELVAEGVPAAAMEVSSHALALDRAEGCRFDVAVFTNLTRDHLDFHRDMEGYFSAKRRLLDLRKPGASAIVNADDPYGRRLLAEAIDLYRWRGTRYGLVRMIEVCTGITPEVTENTAQPYTFDVKITLPKDGDIDKNLIDELIQAHKPAHAGYRLEVL